MHQKTIKIPLIAILIGLAVSLSAQDKQGNIVEYFGKEKVEEIHEGKTIHVFQEGLLLSQRSSRFSSSSVDKSAVFAKFLLEDLEAVTEGQSFGNGATDSPMIWKKISTGEKNEFQDNGLRSGYLYLEYQSKKAQNVLFEASGHTMALINGLPHEGDHYDFGYNLILIRLKKGKNIFVLQGGRFARMRARILASEKPINFTKRDMTLPDVLMEENDNLLGAIRVMNINQSWFTGGSITCQMGEKSMKTDLPSVSPMNVRKVPFQIPVSVNPDEKQVTYNLLLKDKHGKTLATTSFNLNVKSKYKHHKNTFISDIDGSVQYYSVAPSSNKDTENQSLFLSVHGASVEAVNQANAYQQKDWGHLVAPTNRRPFGFAWEDWGRLDALEVLDHAEKLFKTDPQHTYLTGHSMGGHGAWYLGATYPDRWAAIAPCAGYPDLLGYRDSFSKRIKTMDDEGLKRFGMTREQLDKMLSANVLTDPSDILLDSMIRRAGNPSRTLKLKRNYLHYGVYIFHGEKDTVVPTFIAREMREIFGKFHNDFAYYEYPNGSHWFGNHSVDWPPIFDFFKFRSIKPSNEIGKIEFYTASPGVSATSHFVSILQQEKPFEISSFNFERDSISTITTDNVVTLSIDLEKMENASKSMKIDGQDITFEEGITKLVLANSNGTWEKTEAPTLMEKGPHRNGGFKDAFRNNMVFVYATKGSKEENDWYYNRALFDAEKFWYRANGNVELVKDTDFVPAEYPDRNVIIYGNSDNNAAWKLLLNPSPLQVSKGKLTLGEKTLLGNNLGAYFIFPRTDSNTASIGVVTATGPEGMKAAFANNYLVNGTFFPDVMIFNEQVLMEGLAGIDCSGFFGNDWSAENGDFVWRE